MNEKDRKSTIKRGKGTSVTRRKTPLKLRKFRGYSELVADPYNLSA